MGRPPSSQTAAQSEELSGARLLFFFVPELAVSGNLMVCYVVSMKSAQRLLRSLPFSNFRNEFKT